MKNILAGFILALLSPQAQAVAPFRTVALKGQQAAETPAGAVFESFDTRIGGPDRAAFRGLLKTGSGGVDSTNNKGVWALDKLLRPDPLEVHLAARKGHQAPDAPAGAVFDDFYNVIMNDAGKLIFTGDLRKGTGGVTDDNDEGLWTGRFNKLNLFVREGDPAPGLPAGAKFKSFYSYAMNDAGQTVIQAYLQRGSGTVDETSDLGLWSDASGSLALIARTGYVAPGTAGAIFESLGYPFINDTGQVVFYASLVKGIAGVDASNNSGFWAVLDPASGIPVLVARAGGNAPLRREFETSGNSDGGRFSTLFSVLVDAAGHITFSSDLQIGTGGVTSLNNRAIWSDRSGTTSIVVRQGDLAPGLGSDTYFVQLDPSFMVNKAGRMAFFALLGNAQGGANPDNSASVWSDGTAAGTSGPSLTLFARAGAPATGAADANFATFEEPIINAQGRIAFDATLTGSGVTKNVNDKGIWMQSAAGGLTLIIRTGEVMEIAPGDLRTVSVLGLIRGGQFGEVGGGRTFNRVDEILYLAFFTDGSSGVFMSLPPDADVDGVIDADDNCALASNPDQADGDADGVGDACDNCPTTANADQLDSDSDGRGDACDNCPSAANSDQEDGDSDGIGNVCDNCRQTANTQQEDGDADGVGDTCDDCVAAANADQTDTDNDGRGNVCDNCPTVSNPDQADTDGDGIGDACEAGSNGNGHNSEADASGSGQNSGADWAGSGNTDAAAQPDATAACGSGACGAGTAMMSGLVAPILMIARRRCRAAWRYPASGS